MLVVTNNGTQFEYPSDMEPWYQVGVLGTKKLVFWFYRVPISLNPYIYIYTF